VGTGFPKKIMLKQKYRAGWRFEEKSSCSRPPAAPALTPRRRRLPNRRLPRGICWWRA